MAYLYRKNRPPFWYIQHLDSQRNKHHKSTGLRAQGERVPRRFESDGINRHGNALVGLLFAIRSEAGGNCAEHGKLENRATHCSRCIHEPKRPRFAGLGSQPALAK